MKTATTTYLHLLIALATWLAVAACGDDAPQTPAKYLNISVYSPQTVTRAPHDAVEAETEENRIHDVHVWVFLSENAGDTDTPLGYCEKSGISQAGINLQMPIMQESLDKLLNSADGKVDFYVMANTDNVSSLSLTGSGLSTATRAQVRDAWFGNAGSSDDFGGSTATNAGTWDVTANGLPSTKMQKGVEVVTTNGTNKELTKGEIRLELLRAVSRLRFVFSRATDLTDVEIKSITISSADGIYKQEKLFSTDEEQPALVTTAGSGTWSIMHTLTSATPNECDDLSSLKRQTGETAQAYETRMNQAIADGTATEYGRTYIRETNRPLTATITFRCEQTTLTRTVALTSTATAQHPSSDALPRNHAWLVYGYFDKGTLKLTATVNEWTEIDDHQVYENNITLIGSPSWDHYASLTTSPHQVKLINGTAATFTFNINTPKGGTWYASLVPVETENVDAIRFVTTDEAGTETYSMTVSGSIGGEQTIAVKAKDETPSFKSKFRLVFGVRNEGGQAFNVGESLIPQYIILQDLS